MNVSRQIRGHAIVGQRDLIVSIDAHVRCVDDGKLALRVDDRVLDRERTTTGVVQRTGRNVKRNVGARGHHERLVANRDGRVANQR